MIKLLERTERVTMPERADISDRGEYSLERAGGVAKAGHYEQRRLKRACRDLSSIANKDD